MFDGSSPRHREDPGDPMLVADVEEFVSDIASGVYVDGWGYDREGGDHRAFGDEGWALEFDHLVHRAGKVLRSDDTATARQAFRGLLVALGDEHDQGGFPGAGLPDELVDGDLEEAKHRYLRAVWEDEPLESRATAVVTAAEEVCWVRGDPSLAALTATRPVPLPDLDEVLDDLVAALQSVPSGYGFGRQARQWLAEVTQRHRGVDGLAELARTPGPDQAEAYRDWMDALGQVGKLTDAEEAGGEALDRLDPHGRTVAVVAERLAVLAMAREDDDAALDAKRHAWRADPTLERLIGLVDIATALDRRGDVVAAEADRAGEEPLASRPDLAAVLLLDDRLESAEDLVATAGPLGWRYEQHPGPVVSSRPAGPPRSSTSRAGGSPLPPSTPTLGSRRSSAASTAAPTPTPRISWPLPRKRSCWSMAQPQQASSSTASTSAIPATPCSAASCARSSRVHPCSRPEPRSGRHRGRARTAVWRAARSGRHRVG
jgi:hypothetical protein